jgi:hypothetical protein
VNRQVSLDLDELLALAAATVTSTDSAPSSTAAATATTPAGTLMPKPGSAQHDQYRQDHVLASTPLPPVPEPADATFAKAHALASAVAYELGPSLLARIAGSSSDGDGDGPAAVPFALQHWGAASAVIAGAAADEHIAFRGDGAGHAAAHDGKHHAASAGIMPPNIVAVSVLNSAQLGAALAAAAVPGGAGSAALTAGVLAAAPHTVLAVDARGGVHRCRVTAIPSYAPQVVQVRRVPDHHDLACFTRTCLLPAPTPLLSLRTPHHSRRTSTTSVHTWVLSWGLRPPLPPLPAPLLHAATA